MKRVIWSATVILGLTAGATVASAEMPGRASCSLPGAGQKVRYTVLEVGQSGRVVLRTDSGTVHSMSCPTGKPVIAEGSELVPVGVLVPGDTLSASRPGRVSVVRRAWQETGSPE